MSTHEPAAAHPEQPTDAPAPPGGAAHMLPTLQDVMLAVAPARSALAGFCVLWQTGALLSTSKEMFGARGEFLNTRTTLKGRRGKHRISAAGLRAYTEGCPQLSRVDFTGCGAVVTSAAVIALARGCPKLSSLSLRGCGHRIVTDEAVIALSQVCRQLSSLDLGGSRQYPLQITDACVIALSQGCPQLSSLDLYGCNKITSACVIALQACPDIELGYSTVGCEVSLL